MGSESTDSVAPSPVSELIDRIVGSFPKDYVHEITKAWFGYNVSVVKGALKYSEKWRPTLGWANRSGKRIARRRRQADNRRKIQYTITERVS